MVRFTVYAASLTAIANPIGGVRRLHQPALSSPTPRRGGVPEPGRAGAPRATLDLVVGCHPPGPCAVHQHQEKSTTPDSDATRSSGLAR
ncbi:hypothetical protein B0T16DRAFT_399701 [Cercophora newfieldiana]|uniref:Uncharacterized protein n=1 Tax=Cercophora newfieldiana TaxID=92897 RepID=A0AA40CZU8_9PEZI|nr:hypothetical protein B0T16DRAFT_399701 [Cercophora newfieldiana]